MNDKFFRVALLLLILMQSLWTLSLQRYQSEMMKDMSTLADSVKLLSDASITNTESIVDLAHGIDALSAR